jgi:epidermal growth factor receptor substrate 15
MQAVVPPAEFSLPEVVEILPPTESPLPEVVETVPPTESSLPEVVETVPPAPETISEPVEVIIETQESVLKPLAGKKLVIAGTLSHLNREETKVQIQAAGGSVTHSPSSKTDYVVVGKAPGEKLKKAQKLGIAQLSEAQLLKLLGLEF